MKKFKMIILAIFLIFLGIGFCYLIYKTWNIFGFWTLMWTGLLSIISTALLGNLVGSRVENNGVIIYNPKEWPKFLNMLVSLAIGYYLFTIISNPSISSYDYTFGLAYLILSKGIKLTFKDDKILTIKTNNMNFNAKDLLSAYNEIKAKLPEEKKEGTPNAI